MDTPSESATHSNENDSNVTSDNDDAIGAIMNSTTSRSAVTATTNLNHVQQHKDIPEVLAPANIPDKVKIHFVAVGSAPILKRTKFQINSDQRFAAVHVFLRKLLKLSPTEHNTLSAGNSSNSSNNARNQNNLFLYCCSAFAPSPDHLIGELRDSFANVHTKELVIHYSIQEAWG